MKTHLQKKHRNKIWITNRLGKTDKKRCRNDKHKCFVCGKNTTHHHWLCDRCWEKQNIKDGKYKG